MFVTIEDQRGTVHSKAFKFCTRREMFLFRCILRVKFLKKNLFIFEVSNIDQSYLDVLRLILGTS